MLRADTGIQNNYSFKTRIGNWNEELELHQERMKEYLHRKATGQSASLTAQKQLKIMLQPAVLTRSLDGCIHFGDSIMLYSTFTSAVLSTDVSERLDSFLESYSVTASNLVKGAVARNVFCLEVYDKDKKNSAVQNGDVLKFGQTFRLRMASALKDAPFYLYSQPISTSSYSKLSRGQEVTFTASTAFETAWKVQFKDPTQRFEMDGEPVPANAEIVLVHCLTGQALCANRLNLVNDFGGEFEVSGHTVNTVGKRHALQAESHGQLTSDVPAKAECGQNVWAFLTAPASSDDEKVIADSKSASQVPSPCLASNRKPLAAVASPVVSATAAPVAVATAGTTSSPSTSPAPIPSVSRVSSGSSRPQQSTRPW